jgi:hypothetical protein
VLQQGSFAASLWPLARRRLIMVRLRGGKPFGGYRLERPPFFQENCIFAGERFPSADCYVDDAGFQFHRQREPADRLSCNKRGSAAQKWIVDRLTGVAVVLHWSSHALDWLLRRMRGFGILVTAGNAPQSRLLPITGPMPLGSDRVPTGLMPQNGSGSGTWYGLRGRHPLTPAGLRSAKRLNATPEPSRAGEGRRSIPFGRRRTFSARCRGFGGGQRSMTRRGARQHLWTSQRGEVGLRDSRAAPGRNPSRRPQG